MKIKITNGRVIAEAENMNDIQVLLGMGKGKHKKHRKHNFKKVCEVCGKVCRGKKGLGIHMAKRHKV